LPGLRILSRVRPATPSAMNRACHRHTTGLAFPDRRMISAAPQPSALARMILAGNLGTARMNQIIGYTIDQGGQGVARLHAQGDHRSDVTIL
jgi:hypothetical protein